MDPLTITTAVISISAKCVRTARALDDLRGKYKDASMTITAIYSESTVLSSTLAHIQWLCAKKPDALRSTLVERPELQKTLDQALTGCVLVYSVLDEEVQRLYSGLGKEGMSGMMNKVKFLWKEENMQSIFSQLRNQQQALGLLIQALQMDSIHDIRTLLQDNNDLLQGVAQRTKKFRQANSRVRAPSSVFELAVDDVASLYSVDSTATSTNFIFDDMVINSQAYRRVLESRSRVNLAPLPEQSEISSDADTMVEESAPGAQKWNIPSAILRKLTTGELDTLVKSIGGVVREQEDSDWKAKVAEVASEYQTLRKNYVKIKRHFFDMQELKDTHAKELEMMAAERGRMAAEKAELEQSKLCLEGEAERFQEFYRGVDEKRKNLIASHEKELKVKNDRIQQLQEWHAKEKATCQGLRDSNRVRVDEIDRLNLDLVAARKRAEKTAASLKECEEQLARSSDEKASQEEQLQRYRSFDPIIEQLRLISPSSPGSVGGLPERPISAQHGDQEIRLAPSQ